MVMKRSKFIKKALNHTSNTVCVNEEQVEVMLDIFEKLGVLPPETKATPEDFSNLDLRQDFLDKHDFTVNKWDKE
jgi:thiamine phosphate synthase YjbQ (UPF0047 family)